MKEERITLLPNHHMIFGSMVMKKRHTRRKVSIYNEGALAALILDLKIRHKHNNKRSLDDVMRKMWQNYGSNMSGYSAEDYQKVAEGFMEDLYRAILMRSCLK